ncbi:uncharacterized protein LOC125234500 [Leguminivora glycinivorella]|uniref:uncharacterized protein LOC125234500 n=1 Tax=Leguminivora glycinivorella TaxID=1035111 RepID=UPI00200BF664|nr:uncharacterized protein LOC125234500 [Leguminivora glycinivorella]
MKCVRLDMLNIKITFLFLIPFIHLTVQSYNRRRPPDKGVTKRFTMPDVISPQLANSLKIPNKEFCQKMALRGTDFYMVLPWWYHYCERLKDKERNSRDMKDRHIVAYQNVLKKVQDYKKRQKIWEEVSALLRPKRL